MKYSIALNFKYLSMKMNWEKWIFHWEKWNLEPNWNSVHIRKYWAIGKALLAKLYLTVKSVYNLLSVHNLQKISCLNWNNFIWIFIFLRIPLTLKTYLWWTLNELFLFFFSAVCVEFDFLSIQIIESQLCSVYEFPKFYHKFK